MNQSRPIKFLPLQLAALLLSLCFITPAWSKTPTASEQLATLADQYIDSYFDMYPLNATALTSDEKYEDKFVNDLTPEFRAAERKFYADTLKALGKINVRQLNVADRVTRDVLDYELRSGLETTQYDFYRMPINQMDSVPLSLVQLASTEDAQPFRTVAHYEHFVTRLSGFPAWVDSAIAAMREGMAKGVVQPKVLMPRVLAQLKTLIVGEADKSGFYVPVKKFPDAIGEADRVRLTAAYQKLIDDKLTPAVNKLHDFIANEYMPRCRDTAGLSATPDGAAKYALLARLRTTTRLSPEQIHATGLKEVARIRTEMEKVRKQVGYEGDLNAFLGSLAGNPQLKPYKTEADVIGAFKQIQRRVEPTLEKLFSQKPRSPLEIRPEPEITRMTAAAHYNIGTRDGTRPGIFYAPVRDASKYLTPNMTSLFLHEGVPGHHYQLSIALESDLSRFRRYTGFTAYIEGWGLYAEGLGQQLGVYDDPYQYLGRLRNEMHRAIRLVVDTGMHTKGWTREQAIAYTVRNEGGTEADATPAIERYIAIPGQALAYKIGELKILELRHRAEKKLGARFDMRAFHKEILNDAALPIAVLEQKMDRWLASQH